MMAAVRIFFSSMPSARAIVVMLSRQGRASTTENRGLVALLKLSALEFKGGQQEALALVEAAAQAMGQRCLVFCDAGRERSAFHVFAALYKAGMAKGEARDLVNGASPDRGMTEAVLGGGWFDKLPDKYPRPQGQD